MKTDNETKSKASPIKSGGNIDWHEVCHLPDDHPKMKRFCQQVEAESEMIRNADWTGFWTAHEDEGSLAHFDRYVSGDR